ncbi:MAG: amino acid racemase [Rhodospirillaceae bacterium]|nr:amino acid racemase [Rhodospirillaceae bacterium]
MKGVLGILGGMGPLATVDFMQKVIEATPATRDQDHIPLLVHAVPQVPDRAEAILTGSDEPLAWLQEGTKILRAAGAEAIAIPCNTAHYWYDNLTSELDIPVLHIVDAAAAQLQSIGITNGTVGLLATKGTVAAGVYQKRFEKLGFTCLAPGDALQSDNVTAGIAAVKAGDLQSGRVLLEAAARNLAQHNCKSIVLGCTEIPIVLTADMSPAPGTGYLDATQALARAAVDWHLQATGKPEISGTV